MAKRNKSALYILNDTTNTFEDVIMILELGMGYNKYQAEQIATIVHHKGEYPIMRGELSMLEEFEYMLAKHGLTVTIK